MVDTGRIPPFGLVLGFEYELRKRVFRRVRDDGVSLVESLKLAESDYEARELHFTSHLAYGSRGGSSSTSDRDNTRQRGDAGDPNGRNKRKKGPQPDRKSDRGNKGDGRNNDGKKGDRQGGGGKDKSNRGPPCSRKQLLKETPDGRPICFAYNNGKTCDGRCGMAHTCQYPKCGQDHPACDNHNIQG
jgi:hypothetical protein